MAKEKHKSSFTIFSKSAYKYNIHGFIEPQNETSKGIPRVVTFILNGHN